MIRLPPFPVEGGCVCGAVRYRLTAPPLAVYACHCRDCQRSASGPYAIGAIARRDAFVVSGETSRIDRPAESGRRVAQFACARCACRVWNESQRDPETVILRAGTLDEPAWAQPVAHIWTRSRLPWVEIGDAPAFAAAAPSRQVLYDAWSRFAAGP